MLSCFSCVQLYGPHQSPLSLGFSRQEYRSGLPCPLPGDLPDPGNKPASFTSSPALTCRFFIACITWEALERKKGQVKLLGITPSPTSGPCSPG